MKNYLVKPVEFKFGDYISQGWDVFKKDMGDYILAFLCVMVMGIIPFCNIVAMGNFYKFCRNKREGKEASVGDIFDFKDFMSYFTLQLILFAAVFAMYIPLLFIIPFTKNGEEPSPVLGVFMGIYMLAFIAVIFYFSIKAFYMIGLISLEGFTDFKEAWKISKVMTQDNFLNIILFAIVVGFISNLGILLCGIGLIITIPLYYVISYMAVEDGLQQIKKDEIQEIGTQEY